MFRATESRIACSFPKLPAERAAWPPSPSWKMRFSARLVCSWMSFLDGPGTEKKLQKGMGANLGECQRFQRDLRNYCDYTKSCSCQDKDLEVMETGGYPCCPGCWAQDYARSSGRLLLRARKAHLEWQSGCRQHMLLSWHWALVLPCPQLLCFHWHGRLSWAVSHHGSCEEQTEALETSIPQLDCSHQVAKPFPSTIFMEEKVHCSHRGLCNCTSLSEGAAGWS